MWECGSFQNIGDDLVRTEFCEWIAMRDELIRDLATIVDRQLDWEECSFDHSGNCQMHGDLDMGYTEEKCYMVRSRELLRRIEDQKEKGND
jgi:hypothetical protein